VGVAGSFGVVTGATVGTGIGEVSNSGACVGLGTRLNVSVSGGDAVGVEVSIGSGAAVSNGLTDGRGDAFAVEVGVGLGFGGGVVVGVGDSATVTGLLAWKGVEAASCARTNAPAVRNTIAKTNERMVTNSETSAATLARARPPGQEPIQSRVVSLRRKRAPDEMEVDATMSCH
jgi:hypothetical protein